MRHLQAAACLLAILTDPGVAGATEPATMADLRSAYCLPINVAQEEGLRAPVSDETEAKVPGYRKNLADTRQGLLDNIARLRGYILPRAQYVDLVALSVATERGKADYARAKADLDSCTGVDAKGVGADRKLSQFCR
jgi:hypothetical protein